MNTFLHDDPELDALLVQADPVDAAAVRAVAAGPGATSLREAIADVPASPRRMLLRRPAVLGTAAAAAVATVVGITLVNPSSSNRAYGAELIRFAENSPQLLVGTPGWQVTRADEEDAGHGEMTFASGPASLDLVWSAGAHDKDSDKRDMKALGYLTIAGNRAWYGTYGDGDYEAIWSEGDRAIDARGTFPTRQGFVDVATSLHRVDVDAWLAAMPPSVIKPDSRAGVVAQMLADIPQPKGFDAARLSHSTTVNDRYQLGATVTGAVSCAWVNQWAHGDAAAKREAVTAMGTSRHWAILLEMQKQGAWSDTVWEVADYMAGKRNIITLSGQPLAKWVKPALGC
jgi:hypothetical protein